MNNKGKFIVFEGIDGSGKSTISKMLHEKINMEITRSYYTFEPTDSPIGSVIRNILNRRIKTDEKTIAALFLADRLDHIQNESNGILNFLNDGINVISDRYYYSSYAYHVPHISLDKVIEMNALCAAILRPDIVFYLDVSVSESLKRISKNRNFNDFYETELKITQARDNYLRAIEKEGKKDHVVIINANRDIEDIFNEIWNHVLDLFKEKSASNHSSKP
ncbi:MAG: dTMP kinase [Flavobacteriaceae bacterium]|nr:dTMP kinase [Flavobacteriaceae bacterium]